MNDFKVSIEWQRKLIANIKNHFLEQLNKSSCHHKWIGKKPIDRHCSKCGKIADE